MIGYQKLAAVVLGGAVIPVGLLAQVFLAGVGIFHDGAWWQVHAMSGGLLGLPILTMAALALTRWSHPPVRLLALLQAGLYLLQLSLIGLGSETGSGWISALHPANAVLMTVVATVVAQRVASIS
ncbi:hypothetical protein J5J10_04585 [Ciceribacter sp. L1K23]|uniref:DUF6220 domain-containing protein n=1 Tax=Ciceribacter sp. L1K23 TaxID=2820276 RepID=UPI001B818F5F|nr:DUF6220 domain-containing protein [Ciceribacter sp. L1K23]MBR0554951.1 hypothetical protein [Ciceribacter sp. L1K23]